ncbi:MAG: hypothetical protein JWN79_2942 [Gemmatimonadetes bacterium]|jgi:hypothetical protein|nr:hypothetical protein [Gemmatimonadota bacterium]
MSRNETSTVSTAGQSLPSLEPWLIVCLLAFVPAVLIVTLPRAVLVPLLVPIISIMGALLLAGLVMLGRTELKHARASAAARGDDGDPPDARERR